MPSAYRSICCFALLFHTLSAHAISVRDDSGRTISLVKPATRVITLAPNLTEMVFDIGAGHDVVATVQFSNYPSSAKRIPRIGSSDSFNLEAILKYRPQLVLAWLSGNNPLQLRAIERLGIPVYRSQAHSMDGIASTLVRLGKLLGRQDRASALAEKMRSGIRQLKRQYAGRRLISGFYQIWYQPVYTVNGQHVISQIMRLCGVHNIFADAPFLAPSVSKESVLAKDPEMIISGGSVAEGSRNLKIWQNWPQLTAVRAHNLFYIDASIIQQDTPRILEGARVLCRDADIARMNLLALKKGARHTDGENRREE